MMTTSIPHRANCDHPEPITVPARMAGWAFLRCPGCGGATLARTTPPRGGRLAATPAGASTSGELYGREAER